MLRWWADRPVTSQPRNALQLMIAHSFPSYRIARLHLLFCDKCHCTPDGPVHQLRGQLPATKSLCAYRRACVQVCFSYPTKRAVVAAAGQASRFQAFDRVYIKTENGNTPRLFSLFPKSFRNCPNRLAMQRVLGQLAPSRNSSL
ncbi:hypothetical protein FOXG_22088 [Fusarium oxysporum f. sp. lycopersici 4287]|uniref:Uncharacterized protein n=2 Tax=Fusarium oxysporum TaxID=5507 RepID=A0A0J9W526_FUSO4|nr:hypothetical protein FOXG_22088 [Fusarium oxysporum f. sp. lycopersici 4287]EXK23501.1 hypothetical protein FOMG_19721 [Fusarium oxysporum f. sp. melonis 26406]KNB17881.1 hypothetical protein FOXG_22088 [Fusarium oxysporum f. sp. lycopersici 4287]